MGLRPTSLPGSNPMDRMPGSIIKRKLMTSSATASAVIGSAHEDDDIVVPNKKLCLDKDVEVDEGMEEDLGEDKENQAADPEPDLIAKNLFSSEDGGSKDCEESSPKVIVEVQPLPSIYELHENSSTESCDLEGGGGEIDVHDHEAEEEEEEETDQFDSGLSLSDGESTEEDDDDDDAVSADDGEEDEEDEEEEEEGAPVVPSPLYNSVFRVEGAKNGNEVTTPPPPKSIYSDRFWSQSNIFPAASTPPPPSPPVAAPSPAANGGSNTFQFLDQSTQRIECAENGKSYLQLGTMSHDANHQQQQQPQQHHHHHLPVTPIVQPKPNLASYPRRPIPPFRSVGVMSPLVPQPARPVCDHSNCLQRKSSQCYRGQRTRMLNVSLHKLHMARQNHEGCLRRSVLICNMLRHIEDETERESMQEAAATHRFDSPPQAMDAEHYWSAPPPPPPHMLVSPPSPGPNSDGMMTPSQFHVANGTPPPPSSAPSLPTTPPASPAYSSPDSGFDSGLKDFNSAFRPTPFSSPAHHPMEVDAAGNGEEEKTGASGGGINWGSVLSLSNQSELDPLNNNTFGNEPWVTPAATSSMSSSGSIAVTTTTTSCNNSTSSASSTTTTTTSSSSLEDGTTTTVTTSSSMDDIGWKLSADDVLRAFPSDEQIYVGP